MSYKKIPPSDDIYDVNFVFNLNSVNKDIGAYDTSVRQPCKEYTLVRKLVKLGYRLNDLNSLNYPQLKFMYESIKK